MSGDFLWAIAIAPMGNATNKLPCARWTAPRALPINAYGGTSIITVAKGEPTVPQAVYHLPKGYLSHSQIACYWNCPYKYKCRYIDGIKGRPSIDQCFGSALHNTFQRYMTLKRDGYLRQTNWAREFTKDWNKELKAAGYNNDKVLHELGQHFATTYIADYAPDLAPSLIEFKREVKLGDVPYIGVIDLATRDGRVIDYKTSNKAKDAAEAKTTGQLTGYAVIYNDWTGEAPVSCELHNFVKTTGEIQVLHSGPRTAKQIEHYAETVATTAYSITQQVFYKRNKWGRNFLCDEKWCEFWHQCQGDVRQ